MADPVTLGVVGAQVLGGLFGGGKKEKKAPSQVFQTLAQIRNQRLIQEQALKNLQTANTQKPGEVEAAITAMRRKLELARERAGAVR